MFVQLTKNILLLICLGSWPAVSSLSAQTSVPITKKTETVLHYIDLQNGRTPDRAVANIKNLELTEEILELIKLGYSLVAARVNEGKIAPLEQNMFLVELNRLRSMRENTEGKVEIAMFEFRNLIGKKPEDILRLSG